MTKIFEQRKNFDLRRLLAGSERLIDHLLTNDSQRKETRKSMGFSNQFSGKHEINILHPIYSFK